MRETKTAYDERIARAVELARSCAAAAELLALYGELAAFQKSVFEDLAQRAETDVRAVALHFPRLLKLINRYGPEQAAEFGCRQLQDAAVREQLVLAHWEKDAASELLRHEAAVFFARVLLQPYAEYLATRGAVDQQGDLATCPFCGSRPVAAVLRREGDGAKRSLLCSLCSTEWPYRRIVCPNCGEEQKDRLPVYTAAEFDYVRVEACETCRAYIKAVDLTRNGLAVPVVDEIATVALNIWAEERGYTKLEPNLLRM